MPTLARALACAATTSLARRRPFYDPYQAQDLLGRHQAELGIRILPFRQMVYVVDAHAYPPEDEVPYGARTRVISGTNCGASSIRAVRSPPGSRRPRSPASCVAAVPPGPSRV